MKLRSALLAVTTTALVLTSGTAFADTLREADPAGDVGWWRPRESEVPTIDPATTNGDITRSVITHGPRKVKVRIAFRDLRKNGDPYLHIISVQSNKGSSATRTFTIAASPGRYNGRVEVTNAAYGFAACRTAHTIDYTANTVLLEVPRRCLGYPKWVRVSIGVSTSPDYGDTVYTDDALATGSACCGSGFVLGKRVYR